MAWFDDLNLPGATIDGFFGYVTADGPDEDDNPDVMLADGTVTFTATTPAARVDGSWLGIQSVTAQIFDGRIVVAEEDLRPVRLLATDANIGVADWAWKATFDIRGFTLAPLTFKAPRGTTVNLTADLIPIKSQPYQIIEGASIVDAEVSGEGTMRFELSDGSFTSWMDVPNGERGLPGEKGDQGEKGADGVSATLAMGSVTAGTTADAWMTGPPLARELHLSLPRGAKGDKGDTGDKGDKGDPATPISASVTVTEGEAWDASVTFAGGNLGLDFTAAPAGPHTHPVSDVTGLAARLAALEYTSGLRNITSSDTNGNIEFDKGGGLFIERNRNTVTLWVYKCRAATGTGGVGQRGTIPTGFRPPLEVRANIPRIDIVEENGLLAAFPTPGLWITMADEGTYTGVFTWTTRQPAPTLPPGTPPDRSITMLDLTTLTDEQLDTHRRAVLTEQERRAKLAQLPDQLADVARDAASAGCDRDELIERVTDALTVEQDALNA